MPKSNRYVHFHDKSELQALDMNTIRDPKNIQMFPDIGKNAQVVTLDMGIYNDPDQNYILGVEQLDHPFKFTRFGYNTCPNGYCSGIWPGRKTFVKPQS